MGYSLERHRIQGWKESEYKYCIQLSTINDELTSGEHLARKPCTIAKRPDSLRATLDKDERPRPLCRTPQE